MSESPTGKEQPSSQVPIERVVYVMPEQALDTADDEISLREVWEILWRDKWIIVAVTAIFGIGSVVYALQAEEWYRAEVLLAPAAEKSAAGLGGQLGGLAAFAGITVGGGDGAEAVAVLESRGFARNFIEDKHLLPEFFPEGSEPVTSKWFDGDSEERPDIRDAVNYFHENVLRVNQDQQTALVTLAIEWKDPEISAEWANELASRLNSRLRGRALAEAETNVDYLRLELAQTSVVTLQQSIGRLLESELQKLMLARGNEEFAFRVLDRASPPKQRVRPKRALIAGVGTMLGGILAVFVVILRNGLRRERNKTREMSL